ncbi:MAG: hypothetical protein Rubg2KO_37320 [Rubricoccaceae bacterium]
MRTTLNLNDDLARRAKEAAAREQTTLTRLIEEGLRLRLRPPGPPARAVPPHLPVFDGRGGLASGIDPLGNASLRDAADQDES